MIINKLYPYRFELFFFSLISVLFGGIFFPLGWFEDYLVPILYIVNFLSGILMISKTKRLKRLFLFLVLILLYLFYRVQISKNGDDVYKFVRLATYYVFYFIVTIELIKQVWQAKIVTKNVIIGLMCGYICLGLLCFFVFLTIEMVTPGSFNGIDLKSINITEQVDALLYFSYITLLTIGYGEITPVSLIAQKATIITGLMGQFYMVILTATIIGKYISQSVVDVIEDESN